MTVTDFADFGTSQDQASKIAATGVPLLTLSGQLAVQTSITLTTGVATTLGPFAISQPGYEIRLNPFVTGLTLANPYIVQLIWADATSGQTVKKEQWEFWPANNSGGHIIQGTGPTKGSQVTISILTNATAATLSTDVTLLQNSRLPARDDWRTQSLGATISGLTNTNEDLLELILALSGVTVATVTTISRQLPLYCGNVKLGFQTASGTSDATISLVDAESSNIAKFVTDANGRVYTEISLPRNQCSMQLTNSNAASKLLSVYMVAHEY